MRSFIREAALFPLRGPYVDSDRRSPKRLRAKGRPKKTPLRATDSEYTADEKDLIVTYLDTMLTIPNVKNFLREREMPVSGRKPELLKRIQDAVAKGDLTYVELVELLDEVQPWGAQHVFLLKEPHGLRVPVTTYRDPKLFEEHLRSNGASRPLRKNLPLVLPEALTVSAIEHTGGRLRVTAVERRDGFMRDEEKDEWKIDKDGQDVHMRAFVEETIRGLIVFEWDFTTNLAMLQITRLPTGEDYEKAEVRFQRAVSKWIDLSRFPKVDLRAGVKKLHEEEIAKGDKSRARACGITYDTVAGGSVDAKSATAKVSIMSDPTASTAADVARKNGLGRKGNFYWRSAPTLPAGHRGLHVKILAKAGRVHFPTGEAEEDIRYVLEDFRSVC